jgi:AcrR family transcriptional regulator
MPSNTRQRLLEAALWRFYRDGFANVGIDQIIDEVGISKTAFYKHFESKDDLMVAVLDEQTEQMLRQFRELVVRHGGSDAIERLRASFQVLEHYADTKGFKGCVFVNAAIEFPLPHEPVHQAALRNKQAIEATVRELAEAAGVPDPAALASELCLVMEGAYVTRHVTGRTDAVALARRVADRVIASHLGQVDPGRPPELNDVDRPPSPIQGKEP